ncbi:glycosyltransferase family 2 protein [Pedobacter borealis]|uniref:glycosyltransferase family 2 protein n=1 Tax=Pedobacter borealis TaxID=475254 RepID=UPI0004936254|nr:glycosyltransferase family 2 protein [Pedobacter borealis]
MSVVDIAMATYNGEKYIKDQLDSIISQTFEDWRLFVRDDGSNDNTVSIVREYIKKDSRIYLIEDNLGNLRVSRNFEQVLSYCKAPYTMFADQDDIWFENKIEVSLSFIKKVEKGDVSTLVFSNSVLTSETLSDQFGNNYTLTVEPSLRNFLFSNAGYQGSTMIFNEKLKEKLVPFFLNCPVHDYHVSLIALLLGEVYHIPSAMMLYRRHDSATTKQNLTFKERLIWLFKNKSFLYDENMLNYLKEIVSTHEKQIAFAKINLIKDYFQILDKKTSLFKKIKLVLENKFVLRESRFYLIFKLLILR